MVFLYVYQRVYSLGNPRVPVARSKAMPPNLIVLDLSNNPNVGLTPEVLKQAWWKSGRDLQDVFLDVHSSKRLIIPGYIYIFTYTYRYTYAYRYTYIIIYLYYTLLYIIIHCYTLLYIIIHYYTLLYIIIHYYTLLYIIIHMLYICYTYVIHMLYIHVSGVIPQFHWTSG